MDRDILYRFFEGTASFEEEEEVCNWVDCSPDHLKILVDERKFFDVSLLKKKEDQQTDYRKRFSGRFMKLRSFLQYAALFLLLIGSSLSVYLLLSNTKEPSLTNHVIVPPGQRVHLLLSDGTSVWLNACSELEYPASFGKDGRIVHLKGEGYFDVTKDTQRPFFVQTEKFDVKVWGTKFNICIDRDHSFFSTALLEGSVELIDRANPDSSLFLLPMQQAEWKDSHLRVSTIDNFDKFRWKEGLICFENIRFPDLMKRFEKIYDIRIVLQNKRLENFKCSGKCRTADGIDFILSVLQRSRDFSFKRNEENTIIYVE